MKDGQSAARVNRADIRIAWPPKVTLRVTESPRRISMEQPGLRCFSCIILGSAEKEPPPVTPSDRWRINGHGIQIEHNTNWECLALKLFPIRHCDLCLGSSKKRKKGWQYQFDIFPLLNRSKFPCPYSAFFTDVISREQRRCDGVTRESRFLKITQPRLLSYHQHDPKEGIALECFHWNDIEMKNDRMTRSPQCPVRRCGHMSFVWECLWSYIEPHISIY